MLFTLVIRYKLQKMEDSKSIHALAYFNLLKTGSWIEEKIKEALRPFNLTHAQLNVLHLLMEKAPEPVSANELKAGILVSNPDVTRLLDRLVKKQLVIRKTCPDNRRKIDVSLTSEGGKLFNKAHISGKQAIGNFFEEQISEEEAKQLRNIMQKIRR
jgi:DNA-binding MarR family transcriptional regulator